MLLPILLLLGGAGCGEDAREPITVDTKAARDNVEAMAREHAADTAEPSPAAAQEPRRPVISERLPYGEVGNQLVYGRFVFPADMISPLPAIIVIHEWWGLNENVAAMAERLAGEGYIVLAIDLYGGKSADDRDTARALMQGVVEDPASAEQNIREAYEFLKTTAGAPRIASLGWCFGGGWSLNAAMLLGSRLEAAVVYYGQVTADENRLQAVDAQILGLFGAEDRGISVDSVRAFEVALERQGKKPEIHVYPGAGHAFANPTGNNYNPAVAEDAWQKTLDFLGRELLSEGG